MRTLLSLIAFLHPTLCLADSTLSPIFIPGVQQPLQPHPYSRSHEFSLRYVFHRGTHKYPNLHRRLNVTNADALRVVDEQGRTIKPPKKLVARSESLRIERLADRSQEHIDYILDAGRMKGEPLALDASAWTIDDVPGPNVTDKESLLSLAHVAANAYLTEHDDPEWFDVGPGFNSTNDFGWETDGLRGHIFADELNQTVIVGIKGTSPAVFDGSGTTTNDKINDNLFFSCCCGQGGRYGWLQVCDCQTSAFRCNSTCVVEALKNKNRYYYAAQEIYRNVTEIYPNADIWLVGHSLGGSTASLVALTYGLPVVTFEAPGEAMPAKRLGLPTPPGYHLGAHQQRVSTGGFHFGHTADPIFTGQCNTYSSVCTIAGYAMQSVCHTGQTCTYDTVGDLGWRVGAGTHRIVSVIKDVIEKYPEPAYCETMSDCTDCFTWNYFESNHSDVTTTTSKTSTKSKATRTSTCKTPGWWGCLDETTTTEISIPTTTTCKTPGWFGCKDGTADVTTTTDETTTTVEVTTTRDITTTKAGRHTPKPTTTVTSTSSTTCHSPGWFGHCKDSTTSPSNGSDQPTSPPQTSTTSTSTSISTTTTTTTTASTSTTPPESTCIHRSWYGWCKEWSGIDVKLDL